MNTVRVVGLDTETTGLSPDKGDPHRSINPRAQEVHGISLADLASSPDFLDVAPDVVKRLEAADYMVAHNADFDVDFIVSELVRVAVPVPKTQVFCTMEQGRWATANGKLPSLMELCFAVGVEYDVSKAHAAEYDVLVMLASLNFEEC